MRKLLRALGILSLLLFLVAIAAGGGGMWLLWHFGRGLPDYHQLAHYEPPVTTRIHAGDGRLLIEYAAEKRVFMPLKAMPRLVINAFLSAEDKNFYDHAGIDFMGIARAVVTNLRNYGSSRRPVGASTITQQVAKNFLLTNELSLARKVKEMILAFRIERSFSKDRILELYLNEIYLGSGSYGVAAAALKYFNKSLDELDIAEAAYLAALPKAPNNYNPITNREAARSRRDWVIGRMLEDGQITEDEAARARATPLVPADPIEAEVVNAAHFAEEVRRELLERYGEVQLYKGGLLVRTTLDPHLQKIAKRVLREGLEAYDRRHGWRGPVARIDPGPHWRERLAAVAPPVGLEKWRLAVVLSLRDDHAAIGLGDGSGGQIPLSELTWARAWKKDQELGPPVHKPAEALAEGDVVLVDAIKEDSARKPYPKGTYGLRQIPDVDGALVALDPHTGRVLAMAGGYAYERSQFNRATQAKRQPGSAFKPFVYLAALEEGLTPSTLILDAPFVIEQGPGLPKWRPSNYNNEFYGPSTMRIGIEKSRNLMTVRLAQAIGMDRVAEYSQRFGVIDNLPRQLSMSLGAGETTLLKLTAAYGMLVNGGKRIVPTLIDRIQDRHGRTVFRHDSRPCPSCTATFWTGQPVPEIPDNRTQIADPASAYQMVSMLHGVVQRGTGQKVAGVGKPLAGKTGTSNDSQDTWFVGFSPDLAAGVFVGFDEPKTLGPKETGGAVAAPIFRDFMAEALASEPAVPFRIPPGIRLVRVNAVTGHPARPDDASVIFEAFKSGTLPTANQEILEGFSAEATEYPPGTMVGPSGGTGGLY